MTQDTASDFPSFVSDALLPSVAADVRAFLASRALRAFLVGGAVRDALLGRGIDDVDVVVETSVSGLLQTGRALAHAFDGVFVVLDRNGGAVRVVLPTGCVLDLVAAPDGLARDLARRDFTINAMAIPLSAADAGVIDLYHGRNDLAAGVLRAVSPTAFDDDPIRLIRAPRLAAQLGLTVYEETRTAIRLNAQMLNRSSPERVRDELLKLIAAPDAMSAIRELDDLGLLTVMIPELDEARGVSQPKEHYWDVFDHCVETVGRVVDVLGHRLDEDDWTLRQVPSFPDMDSYFAERISDGHSRSTLVRLSALLHDIAKPATKTREENGRIRFFGHHKAGGEIADAILGRLRLGTRGRQFVTGLVCHHLRPTQLAERGALPTRRATFRYYKKVGDGAISTLYLNMADYLAARGPLLERGEWKEHCALIAHILNFNFEKPPAPRLINGTDVIDGFAVGPGPLIGVLLDAVREAQAAGEVATRDEAMQLVGRMLETNAADTNGRHNST